MDAKTKELIKGFIEESAEGFSNIENELIEIESNPGNLNTINSIFRVMHTIKGTAGFLKLDNISKLSHIIESIFDLVRCKKLTISPEIMDEILPSIDLLKAMVFDLLKDEKPKYKLDETLDVLRSILAVGIQEDPLTENDSRKVDDAGTSTEKSARGELSRIIGTLPNEKEDDERLIEQFNENAARIPASTRRELIAELNEHILLIEECLLKLEMDPENEGYISDIFRSTHSLKAAADYVNLNVIKVLAHHLESIFEGIRSGDRGYTPNQADMTLEALDMLRKLTECIKAELQCSDIKITRLIKSVEATEDNPVEPVPQAKAPFTADTLINTFRNTSVQQMLVIQHMGENYVTNTLDNNELAILHRSIRTLKNVASNVGAKSVAMLTSRMEELLLPSLTGEMTDPKAATIFQNLENQLREEVTALNKADTASFMEIATGHPKIQSSPIEGGISGRHRLLVSQEAPPDQKSDSHRDVIKSTRIDSERLETFMNLIGELVITKNGFSHILGSLADLNIPTAILQELKGIEGSFNRISKNLQRNLMDIRLVPVKNAFQKIPRIVRDISRKTNKSIQLQMIGEDTEIDKYIVEMIGDPLIHIVRNCCDHGIETSEVRSKSGKTSTGKIVLKASQTRNNVLVEIIDDGAGLDTKRILDLAVEKGLVTREKGLTMPPKSIHNFIFSPGFSTATEITDISGRGVGMDVVNTNIKRVNGSVDVESTSGSGTQVTMVLPLTLAVIDALLIIDQTQKYAIPLDYLKETIEIHESQIQTLNEREVIRFRDDVIGIERLSNLLDIEKAPRNIDETLSLVILQSGQQIMGLLVDDLLSQEQIVVKPLQRYLAKIIGLSGSAILGNGEIILILDPLELISLATQ